MTKITCETEGHLYNSTGKCVMCGHPKPEAPVSSNQRLPCPFCGGKDIRSHHRGHPSSGEWVIECHNCSCELTGFASEQDAWKRWSARPSAPETKSKWKCGADRSGIGGNMPQDCDWPYCGCDETATKVIEALQEQGWMPVPRSASMPNRVRPEKSPNKSGVEYIRELVTYCGLTQQAIFGIPFSRELEFLLEHLANAQDDALQLHHAYVDLKYPQSAPSAQETSARCTCGSTTGLHEFNCQFRRDGDDGKGSVKASVPQHTPVSLSTCAPDCPACAYYSAQNGKGDERG